MASKFEAIHWDMDGVIADTEPLHVAAERQTCVDYGFDVDPDDWSGFKGRTAQDIFSHLIKNYGNPKIHKVSDLIDHKTDVFLERAKTDLQPIEGVLDFMEWAREAHEKMSLVTSSNRRIQTFIIDALNIRDMFDTLVNGDDITNGKPHPEPYQMAIAALGVGADRSLVVEDSTSGIRSGQAAGCSVLAIATSHTPEELEHANPDFIAENYKQAREILIG